MCGQRREEAETGGRRLGWGPQSFSPVAREPKAPWVGNVLCVVGRAPCPSGCIKREAWARSDSFGPVRESPCRHPKPPAPLSNRSRHAAPAELTPTGAETGFSWRKSPRRGNLDVLSIRHEGPPAHSRRPCVLGLPDDAVGPSGLELSAGKRGDGWWILLPVPRPPCLMQHPRLLQDPEGAVQGWHQGEVGQAWGQGAGDTLSAAGTPPCTAGREWGCGVPHSHPPADPGHPQSPPPASPVKGLERP